MAKTMELQRLVALSNEVAEYPPVDLSKLQYQALLVLVSCIDSTQKPVYGVDDIKDEILELGITSKQKQMAYLEQKVVEQNTYRIPYREYVRYFTGGDTPRGGVIKRAMDAVLSLKDRPIKINNPEFEGSFAWFQAVLHEKKSGDLIFVITSFAKPFLMGLKRNFLQMLAKSTMEFDGKYSVPIFLYMKSKLYDGRAEFHGQEPIETFRRRFGLDKIKTYNKFYDFQRRVLDVATEDSKKSGDIKFFFTGVAKSGSKKIATIKYSIFRIGDIKKQLNAKSGSSGHGAKVGQLTQAQFYAYKFLADKGVNKSFIVENILSDPKLKYELVTGHEDLYAKVVWAYFDKASKARVKAGAFVSWWKNGRLTKDSVHAVIVERLWERVKKLPDNIKGLRKVAKTMTHSAYNEYLEKHKLEVESNKETVEQTSQAASFEQSIKKLVRPTGAIRSKKAFDFEQFKLDYAAEYKRISKERMQAFQAFKDIPNYKIQLENSIKSYCEQWFKGQYK